MDKKMLIGIGGMLVGGVLVVGGLLQIPVLPVVLIVIGGALGYVGNKVYRGEIRI